MGALLFLGLHPRVVFPIVLRAALITLLPSIPLVLGKVVANLAVFIKDVVVLAKQKV